MNWVDFRKGIPLGGVALFLFLPDQGTYVAGTYCGAGEFDSDTGCWNGFNRQTFWCLAVPPEGF